MGAVPFAIREIPLSFHSFRVVGVRDDHLFRDFSDRGRIVDMLHRIPHFDHSVHFHCRDFTGMVLVQGIQCRISRSVRR